MTSKSLKFYIAWEVTKHNGSEFLRLPRQWMEKRIIFHRVSISDHCLLQLMFRNALQRPHAFSNDFTRWTKPMDLVVFVSSVRLLSSFPCSRLDVMICRRVRGHGTCTSPQFTAEQDGTARSGIATTAGCVPSLEPPDDTSTSASSRWYADYGSTMTSNHAVFWLHYSVKKNLWGLWEFCPLHATVRRIRLASIPWRVLHGLEPVCLSERRGWSPVEILQHAFAQQIQNAAPCRWVGMTNDCTVVMDDPIRDWSVSEFIELPARCSVWGMKGWTSILTCQPMLTSGRRPQYDVTARSCNILARMLNFLIDYNVCQVFCTVHYGR